MYLDALDQLYRNSSLALFSKVHNTKFAIQLGLNRRHITQRYLISQLRSHHLHIYIYVYSAILTRVWPERVSRPPYQLRCNTSPPNRGYGPIHSYIVLHYYSTPLHFTLLYIPTYFTLLYLPYFTSLTFLLPTI